jgi:hypothetical protein
MDSPRLIGGSITDTDPVTGVIKISNNSIQGGPFTKFDPQSKFGYSSRIVGLDGGPPTNNYFKRDINNIDNPITLDEIPNNIKKILGLSYSNDLIYSNNLINSEEESNNIIYKNLKGNFQEYIIGISVLIAILVVIYLYFSYSQR